MVNNSMIQSLLLSLTMLISTFVGMNVSFASDISIPADQELDPRKIVEEAKNIAVNIKFKTFGLFPNREQFEILKDIAIVQAEVGDRPGAAKTFDNLIERIMNTKDISPNARKRQEMNRRNFPEGHDFTEWNERSLIWEKVHLLIDIAMAQVRAQGLTVAARTFQRAVRTADGIPNDYQHSDGKIFALKEIAIAQIKSKDSDGVRTTLKDIFQAMHILKEKRILIEEGYETFKIRILMDISKVWAQVGDRISATDAIQKSLEVAERIEDKQAASWAFRDIAIAQGWMGDREAAMKTIQKLFDARGGIQDSYTVALYNSIDLLNVTSALIQSGKPEGATGDIEKAIEMMKVIEIEKRRSSIWRKISIIRAQLGDITGAFSAEAKITDESFKGEAIPIIADVQINAEDYSSARKTADLVGVTKRLDILKRIVIAQANNGDIQGALHTLETLCCTKSEIGKIRSEALREVAMARTIAGEPKETLKWAFNQNLPQEKVYALLGVAEGIAKRK